MPSSGCARFASRSASSSANCCRSAAAHLAASGALDEKWSRCRMCDALCIITEAVGRFTGSFFEKTVVDICRARVAFLSVGGSSW